MSTALGSWASSAQIRPSQPRLDPVLAGPSFIRLRWPLGETKRLKATWVHCPTALGSEVQSGLAGPCSFWKLRESPFPCLFRLLGSPTFLGS